MSVPAFLDRSAIVMAHPDDEMLWASSVLGRVDRILLCYEEVPHKPAIAEGRRKSLARFPLPNASNLGLEEAAVLNGAAWPEPRPTGYGLAVRRKLRSLRGFSAARYRAQFETLRGLLRDRLAGTRNVITHNPWGEYGHEDHVQVFRAVTALQPELGYAVWVSGYCSNKSIGFMQRCLGQLGQSTPLLPTDRRLAADLMALYRETGCWTWFDDYVWPEQEAFHLWIGNDGPPRRGTSRPLDLVWLDPPVTAWDYARRLGPADWRRILTDRVRRLVPRT